MEELFPIFKREPFIHVVHHAIVLKIESVKAKYPGGMKRFSDEHGVYFTHELAAICSMSAQDMDEISEELMELGFKWDEDMAAIDAGRASMILCMPEEIRREYGDPNDAQLGYDWLKGDLVGNGVNVRLKLPTESGNDDLSVTSGQKHEEGQTPTKPTHRVKKELDERRISVMYSPDTLERLSAEEIAEYQERVIEVKVWTDEEGNYREEGYNCEQCEDYWSCRALPVYNPADGVCGVEGAYSVLMLCESCYASREYLDERFYCDDCGELFIYNHNWDVLAVNEHSKGELYCQKCYWENHLEPVTLEQLLDSLNKTGTGSWKRMNNVPGKMLLVELDYAPYRKFPGHKTLKAVGKTVRKAATKAGLAANDLVYPVIRQKHQFSYVLGVFTDTPESDTD